MPCLLITGGAGFIGSSLVRMALEDPETTVVNLDLLTYAGNPDNLQELTEHPRHCFVQGDICDRARVTELLVTHRVEAIVNLAAESHVDRSIDAPGEFVRTNVTGTFELLEAARAYRATLTTERALSFRYVQVSTDEVFGSLGADGMFTERTAFAPSSPYAASKAAADHLVRAYCTTYGLPTLVTHCSNNYGPRQFPEKLIPLMVLNALEGKALPVYGAGSNVRDWLYVPDHCDGILRVLARGIPGQSYCLGGGMQRTNLEVVHTLCDILDGLRPRGDGRSYRQQITFVADRPGHDLRYAIDASRARTELEWEPRHDFATALRATVDWYLANRPWCERITAGVYRRERLGLGAGATP